MADQPMESPGYPDAPLSEARSPVERLFRSPRATHMVRGVGFVADEPLIEAARYNRRVAIRRAIEASWPAIPSFRDVMQMPDGTNLDGTPVAAVHGDADFGNQGAQRQTYEVLSFCSELLRYELPLHPYHRRLYAWAPRFPPSNNFGRLRRVWPTAVFLPRSLADRLDVPFAQEGGLEDYLEQLANSASSVRDWDHSLMSHLVAGGVSPAVSASRRAYLAPAWASGLTRAPMHFNLSRWLPKTPPSALLNDTNAAWSFVYDELHSFVLAAWVYALHHDGIFARMSAEQLEAFNSLGTNGLESEEDGDVRRDTFHKMCKRTMCFPGGYY
ncbi:hypothetical protein MMPV_006874 [Pyropia vietnamensis]